MPASVVIETPARLHFGLIDLHGWMGRRFGGVGACAPGISARVVVSRVDATDAIDACGDDAERAAEFARRFLRYHGLHGGIRIDVERAIPAHAGLGSGTQLALSIGRALADLFGVQASSPDLARAVGRAKRSAVGTWTFDRGGFVVEGGRHGEDDAVGPLLARVEFPASWRCVLTIPRVAPSVSGLAEAQAFASLPVPPIDEAKTVAYLVLMGMLPAIIDADIKAFGAALSEVQEINGRWFSHAQGGTFAPGLSTEIIRVMQSCNAPGVGQSSWGPSVYALVDGDEAAHDLANRVRATFGDRVTSRVGPFPSHGARITRA